MKKKNLDSNLQKTNFAKKENYFSFAKIRDVFFRYKLMILGATIASCTSPKNHTKSREILSNKLNEHKIAEIYGIDVFKDTLLYSPYSKYIYSYEKFKDSLVVDKKIDSLKIWVERFPPGFLEKMELDTIFFTKNMKRRKKTGEKNHKIQGLYRSNKDEFYLSDIDVFPHELTHKILKKINFNYKEWAKSIYGENFAEFYKKPQKNSDGYYNRSLGFITSYAQTSIGEDLAETIEDLMKKNSGELLINDEILQKKIKSSKKILLNLDNRFTEQYWKDLQAGKVNKQYWENKNSIPAKSTKSVFAD